MARMIFTKLIPSGSYIAAVDPSSEYPDWTWNSGTVQKGGAIKADHINEIRDKLEKDWRPKIVYCDCTCTCTCTCQCQCTCTCTCTCTCNWFF
jgi:hypothetical protein